MCVHISDMPHTVTPSPTVTHSPGMMEGGVNVAAVVAIPVVLVLVMSVVVVVVVCAGFYLYYRNKGLE